MIPAPPSAPSEARRNSFLPTVKTTVEAAKDWVLARIENGLWLRSTKGNPDFSRTATVFYALSADAADIDTANGHKNDGDDGPVLGQRTVRRVQTGTIDQPPSVKLVKVTPPICAIPALLDLAKFMGNALASHDGWETEQGIRALEAAVEGKVVVQQAADRKTTERP